MGRIKIDDLPKDQKISVEEMRRVHGGIIVQRPTLRSFRMSYMNLMNPYLMEPGDDGYVK